MECILPSNHCQGSDGDWRITHVHTCTWRTTHVHVHSAHVHVQCMCIVNRVHYTSFYMYSLRDRYIHALCKSPIEPPVSKLNPSQEYVSYQVCVCVWGGGGGELAYHKRSLPHHPQFSRLGTWCPALVYYVLYGLVRWAFLSFLSEFLLYTFTMYIHVFTNQLQPFWEVLWMPLLSTLNVVYIHTRHKWIC